jgi:hypothetical protein
MTKTFLYVGCGPKHKDRTTTGFAEWSELRFDIDESVQPDLVGTMTDMSSVLSESVDSVFSSHNIEHLYPHEVTVALSEILRVLKPDGFAVITCPDLQAVCALVAEEKLTEPAYTFLAGPIAPLDILYGRRPPYGEGQSVHGSPLWIYRESTVWNPTVFRLQKCRIHEAGCSLL